MTISRPEARYMRVYSSVSHYINLNGRRIDFPPGTTWFDLDEYSDDIQIDSDATINYTSIKPLLTYSPEFPVWVSGANYSVGNKIAYYNNIYICIISHISQDYFERDFLIDMAWRCITGDLGSIIMRPHSANMVGMLPCDGKSISLTSADYNGWSYFLLYQLISIGHTTYNDTVFNILLSSFQSSVKIYIPDLRGLFPAFTGTSGLYNLIGSTKYHKTTGYIHGQIEEHRHHTVYETPSVGSSGSNLSRCGIGVNDYAARGTAGVYTGDGLTIGVEGYPAYYGLSAFIKY